MEEKIVYYSVNAIAHDGSKIDFCMLPENVQDAIFDRIAEGSTAGSVTYQDDSKEWGEINAGEERFEREREDM